MSAKKIVYLVYVIDAYGEKSGHLFCGIRKSRSIAVEYAAECKKTMQAKRACVRQVKLESYSQTVDVVKVRLPDLRWKIISVTPTQEGVAKVDVQQASIQ